MHVRPWARPPRGRRWRSRGSRAPTISRALRSRRSRWTPPCTIPKSDWSARRVRVAAALRPARGARGRRRDRLASAPAAAGTRRRPSRCRRRGSSGSPSSARARAGAREPSRWLWKRDALLVERAQLGQAEDLVAAAVGEDTGPRQPVKPCRPPRLAHQRVARAQHQVIGVGEDDLRARLRRGRARVTAFTAAAVPTGMKAGVSTAPCGVVQAARARARPPRCPTVNENMSRGSISTPASVP